MSGINPQGCQVYSFKAPTSEDLDHDYRWRCAKALPERGRIGIFNRSYYDHLFVVRKEQEKRFRERLEKPDKNWKFSAADLKEREYWRQYHEAYEDMIRRTATPDAPWYVVPADNKWFTRVVVAAATVDAIAGLKLEYPRVSKTQMRQIARARRLLNGRSQQAHA
jgi:polyphosphate kinase 2 (PPK2 family)